MKKAIKKTFKNLKDIDIFIAVVSVLFFSFGLLNILSASSETVVRYNLSLFHFMQRHFQFLVVGLGIFLVVINIDTKKMDKIAFWGFLGVLSLNIALLIFGEEHKGNLNWLPGIGGQPSEFAKPFIILLSAIIFERSYKSLKKRDLMDNKQIYGIILIVLFAIPFIVTILHGDAGGGGLMGLIALSIFLCSPIKFRDKKDIVLALTGAGILLVLFYTFAAGGFFSQAQASRLTGFRDPCSNYEGSGFQVCNSLIAINEGGLFGVGIGNSTQKHSYIPDAHTDMVFAIISEEIGLIGAGTIIILMFFMVKRILDISKAAANIRGRYIALGVAFYMFFHIFINLGGLFAIIPLTGVPLPFFSYGGSFTLSFILGLSLVQRVHIEAVNKKIKLK